MAPDRSKSRGGSGQYSTKKCPFCYTYLPLHANRCTACKKKIGEVDKLGFASKPFDWGGYVIAIASIIAFSIFMWWGFFRE
jgi:hypothetical protein